MMINKTLLFVLVFSFVLIAGCSKRGVVDSRPTEEDFGRRVQSFPYRATDERKRAILENYNRLELGMTKGQVEEIIGEPDYWNTTGPGKDNVTGSGWVYGFFCTGRFCGTTGDDDLIEIFFDLDDKVTWIAPSPRLNLEGKRVSHR